MRMMVTNIFKFKQGDGMNKHKLFLLLVALMGLVGIVRAEEPGKSGYTILQKVSLPGDGGWDFLTVDSEGRRVYIAHNNSIQVVDADSLKLIGTVENVPHPHGVVFLPELGKGYATSGDPGSVVVFDLKTFQRLTEIPASKDA